MVKHHAIYAKHSGIPEIKTVLGAETAELLQQFDDWRPTTKALKDVKYRLEAVRSRL